MVMYNIMLDKQPNMDTVITKENTITNNKVITKAPVKIEHISPCCACYNSDSFDARCCGACYYYCPPKNKENRCEFCPINFSEYWNSGYVQTQAGYGREEKNGCCCFVCFPLKFPMFFTCFLGSLCNNCINWYRDTQLNYLC
jgi:hypothetical protein